MGRPKNIETILQSPYLIEHKVYPRVLEAYIKKSFLGEFIDDILRSQPEWKVIQVVEFRRYNWAVYILMDGPHPELNDIGKKEEDTS